MRKIIYLAIARKLKASVPGVRYISLWNENTTNLERESSYGLPAVFIEFEPVRWEQRAEGVKCATIHVRLHIVTETLADPSDGSGSQSAALEHFDAIDAIVYAVSGLAGEGFNRLQHTESVSDHNHDQIQHNIETFTCEVRDLRGQNKLGYTTAEHVKISVGDRQIKS